VVGIRFLGPIGQEKTRKLGQGNVNTLKRRMQGIREKQIPLLTGSKGGGSSNKKGPGGGNTAHLRLRSKSLRNKEAGGAAKRSARPELVTLF